LMKRAMLGSLNRGQIIEDTKNQKGSSSVWLKESVRI
jgi:hypothetical protein